MSYTHQCRNKRRYTSKRMAGGTLRVMQQSMPDQRLHVYRCPACAGWHVGNMRHG